MNDLAERAPAAVPASPAAALGRRRFGATLILGSLVRDRAACVGLVLVLGFCFVALSAPWLAPYPPDWADPALRLRPPGTEGHWLGLDHQGRDVLSRLIWGTRLSLLTGVVPVVVGALLALPLGLLAAWYERAGQVVMRAMDALFAFPMVLLAIMVAAYLGPGLENMMLSLVITLLPYNTRVVFQAAREQKDLDYVEALRACATPAPVILFVELLPNVASAAIVYSSTIVGSIVIAAAGLSFLGLGVQPPTAEWGIMVSEGRGVIFTAPHVAALPGLAITLLVIAFNLVGDGLRDALDPRLRASLAAT
jgi:ABC-type dipeptide/oligopeptide/nickel transport system permease subunit